MRRIQCHMRSTLAEQELLATQEMWRTDLFLNGGMLDLFAEGFLRRELFDVLLLDAGNRFGSLLASQRHVWQLQLLEALFNETSATGRVKGPRLLPLRVRRPLCIDELSWKPPALTRARCWRCARQDAGCYPASDLLARVGAWSEVSVETTVRPARQATMARAKVAPESCSTCALTPIAAPSTSPTLGGFRRVSASPRLCSACPHRLGSSSLCSQQPMCS